MFASDNQVGGLLPQTLLKQRFATVEPVEQNGARALYRGIDTHNGNHRVAILEMSQAKPGARVWPFLLCAHTTPRSPLNSINLFNV